MLKRSYFCFLKERLSIAVFFASFYMVLYCLTRSYGLSRPAKLTILDVAILVAVTLVFIFCGAAYQFFNQE